MSEENTVCSVVLTESTSKKRAVINYLQSCISVDQLFERDNDLLAAPDDAKRRTDPKAI